MTDRYSARLSLGIVLAAMLIPQALQSAELQIAVASNFYPAARQLATVFRQQTGHDVRLSPGSTGKLYAQIVNGAPHEIFLAADVRRPQRLEAAGLAIAGSRFTYARGMLVVWSADPALITGSGLPPLSALKRIAIANPKLAPYGAAAQETLQQLGLWEAAQPKLVRGESIGQTYQFVATRNADLGFIAGSQLDPTQGSHWAVPEALHEPVDQQLVVLTDSPAAKQFASFLRSPAAQTVILAAGYLIPGE